MLRLHNDKAGDFARLAIDNITREYPNYVVYVADGPGAARTNRELHPAFYGSFDWHSCVEMHWTLVRLMRRLPSLVPTADGRSTLSGLLTADNLAAETAFFQRHKGFQRPYGWGWLLTLAHELERWDDVDAHSWRANLDPLVRLIEQRLIDWLPLAAYPVRYGMHSNSAFGLARSLPYATTRAEGGDAGLLGAIVDAATRWFSADRDYPAHLEPSGSDFLSPALTETELMAAVLPPDAFASWLDGFLPGLGRGEPTPLFEPAVVSDPTDGQIAHLHGLNLSRAFGWRRLTEVLPDTDDRQPPMRAAIERHADASLGEVVGSDYMIEHWLAAYAVLLLT